MISLVGYADRLSVRPGETIKFHVSNDTGAPVAARIVRVVGADPNPAGPGIAPEPTSSAGLQTLAEPQSQKPPQGSYALVGASEALAGLKSFTILLTVYATRLGSHRQVLWAIADGADGDGFEMGIDADGVCVVAVVRGGKVAADWRSGHSVGERRWMHVALSYDAASNAVSVCAFAPGGKAAEPSQHVLAQPMEWRSGSVLSFAGRVSGVERGCFNGKLEAPTIFGRALSWDECRAASRGEAVGGIVASWDFSQDMGSQRIVDTGPHGQHGTLVNTPTRAVRGSSWTGREQCFRHAPDQYAAIHFHEDDIDDCCWPATHAYTVPHGTRSAAYALLLKAGDAEENIPFFVVPPKGAQTAKLAVLVSTFTYTIYGNHARPEWMADRAWRDAWLAQAKEWHAYPHNPGDHREYGLSTYNYHSDGSGIAMASWKRPMLNLRLGYLTYPYPEIRGSGLRHYPADSHLLSWLEAKGYDYDVITDYELHHEGAALLNSYTCVTTGSHPEYHTGAMLDALEAYRDGGGRFMYLGGNGFYWKIALAPDRDGVIEIRRAEGGIRAWAAEPGEYYNQFDGEYGGLWRRNGRPPQSLVGVGFTAQGNFVGSHYHIDADARKDPRTAWIFDGVTDDIIGGFGLSGHGAAGFELDRADKRLGTPENAVVVARSEDHPPEAPWVLVPEEQLTHITTIPGQSHKQLIRADMTFFETAGGGAVFSTGSITYCGSLPHNGFDNSISRLTENVLRRFLDGSRPFVE